MKLRRCSPLLRPLILIAIPIVLSYKYGTLMQMQYFSVWLERLSSSISFNLKRRSNHTFAIVCSSIITFISYLPYSIRPFIQMSIYFTCWEIHAAHVSR
jgi:hypothetical protein